MVKNSQSNKNIIQINNLVKMAEEKKRRPRRRQVVQKEEEVVEPQMPSRIMQQMPPQLQPIIQQSFPGNGPDQDLNQALRDAVSSQAAQLNEMRDQRDRENEMYAQAINGIASKISDKEERLFNRGQGRASNEASGPVEIAGTDVFADDKDIWFVQDTPMTGLEKNIKNQLGVSALDEFRKAALSDKKNMLISLAKERYNEEISPKNNIIEIAARVEKLSDAYPYGYTQN
jgi:membrane-associated HD superfamily phosphohydrolase